MVNKDKRICPMCQSKYLNPPGYNALSMKDRKTEICPDCGMNEAFRELGIDKNKE
jgi:RNA polymerase subunit RPABC4/transcription elongation factor Spt4